MIYNVMVSDVINSLIVVEIYFPGKHWLSSMVNYIFTSGHADSLNKQDRS